MIDIRASWLVQRVYSDLLTSLTSHIRNLGHQYTCPLYYSMSSHAYREDQPIRFGEIIHTYLYQCRENIHAANTLLLLVPQIPVAQVELLCSHHLKSII